MSDSKLKSIVERAEKVIEERKAVSGDLRDIFSEAKGVGYEPRFVRKIIAERAMDAADLAEQEAVMDAYRHALGMAAASVSNGDMSLREAARESGFSKSAIQRPSHQMRDTPCGTVEMTEGDLGEWLPAHDAETGELPREMVADDLGDPLLILNPFRAKIRALAASVKRVDRTSSVGAEPRLTGEPHEIDIEIPAFLDKRKQAAI